MWRKYYKVLVMLAVAAAGLSCASGGETGPVAGYGVLDLGSLAVAVASDDISNGDAPATRAVSTGSFEVRILDYKQRVVSEWTVAEHPGEIRLQAGDYTLEVCSPVLHEAEWESPWYSATKAFTITHKSRVDLGTVTCRLSNIKVTVRYSEELYDKLGDDVSVTVKIGDNTLPFGPEQMAAGYFRAPGETADMTVVFTGTIEGVHDTYTEVVRGVRAGEWERVRFTFEENDGARTFHITVFDSGAGQIGNGSDWF